MILNFIKFYSRRNFSRSSIYSNIEKVKPNEPTSTSSTSASPGMLTDFIPNKWHKKILVWSGKCKSDDIPPKVSFATMDNAKSRLRIRIANLLMLGTLVMCGYYVYIGKESKKRGDSFAKREFERQQMLMAKNE